jgi:hypothetical protein
MQQTRSTTASHLARKCYDTFTMFKRTDSFFLDSDIILSRPERLSTPQTQTFHASVQTAVTLYCYSGREQNFVRLPASWNEDGTEFASIYPSFISWKTGFQGDFSKTKSVRQPRMPLLQMKLSFDRSAPVRSFGKLWTYLKRRN